MIRTLPTCTLLKTLPDGTSVVEIDDQGEVRFYTVRPYDPGNGGSARWFNVGKEDGSEYQVKIGGPGETSGCGCKGYRYRGACRHLDAMQQLVADGKL